jgi:hypothetical protein
MAGPFRKALPKGSKNMKLPKTFVPDKNLEGRTEDLMEEEGIKRKTHFIDPEAQKLFPNFVKHLKKEYDILYIQRLFEHSNKAWMIYTEEDDEKPVRLGMIGSYFETEGPGIIYGYEVEIRIKGDYSKLIYRLGYRKFDTQGKVISDNSPKRLDEEEIPFP